MILHGHVRLTGDVDFFFAHDRANSERLFAALERFWDGDVPGLEDAEALGPEGTIVQFGVPPNRIDLINSIEGVDFEEAWDGRLECLLVTQTGEVPLPYIGLAELIKNKRATGRPKDLDDLQYLTGGDVSGSK